jgi:hypothetical protein
MELTRLMDFDADSLTLPAGSVMLTRGATPPFVTYVESGRVTLGVLGAQGIEHQLGGIQGPIWLEATSAVLDLPSAVDGMAQTSVHVRRMPLAQFRAAIESMPVAARTVLQDVAKAHRQQTELAVSRLAKDAEARCAEWLLRHAQTSDKGGQSVLLEQRKRLIAAQLGIAPETLSRVLRHLREQSLISGTGRVLKLLDPTGLRSLAGV